MAFITGFVSGMLDTVLPPGVLRSAVLPKPKMTAADVKANEAFRDKMAGWHAPVGHNGIRSTQPTYIASTAQLKALSKQFSKPPSGLGGDGDLVSNDPNVEDHSSYAPPGWTQHADGRISPDLYSSEYQKALNSMKESVKNLSYTYDGFLGHKRGTCMQMVMDGLQGQQDMYDAFYHVGKGLVKQIQSEHGNFTYNLPDPIMPDYGNGDPDFHTPGWGAAQSTIEAIRLSTTGEF